MKTKVLLAALLCVATLPALAQGFPTKAVKIIIPYPPGGSIDTTARMLAPKLQEKWGQPVVVENRPGASGQIGMDAMAKSAPDGHTVALSSPGAVAINGHFKPMAYDPVKDLAPITVVAITPLAIAVNSQIPANTFAEYLAYARANPKDHTFSVTGQGTQTHLSVEMMRALTGLNIVAVPYRGTQPATNAILAAETEGGISDLSTLLPLHRAKRLKLLAVLEDKRVAIAPDVPTAAESGLPGFDAKAWVAMFAPAGTPVAALDTWHAAIAGIMAQPDVKASMEAGGKDIATVQRAAMPAFIAAEIAKWGEVIRKGNIKLEE